MATGTVEPKPTVIEKLNLTWLLRLFTSTIGRKVVMGITGLGLCGFLVVHLAGNLFLYQGREAFDGYAHALHEQEWLPLAEVGLFALFVLHIWLAFVTTRENRLARKQAYALKESKREDRILPVPPSTWMFISGAVVLGFLLMHIIDMKLQARGDIEYATSEHEAFINTVAVLSNPISQVIYGLGVIFLGFHLSHGVSSAFQSLGLNHPKYTPLIKLGGVVFAIVIALGFFSIPVIVPRSPVLLEEWNAARASAEADPATEATNPH